MVDYKKKYLKYKKKYLMAKKLYGGSEPSELKTYKVWFMLKIPGQAGEEVQEQAGEEVQEQVFQIGNGNQWPLTLEISGFPSSRSEFVNGLLTSLENAEVEDIKNLIGKDNNSIDDKQLIEETNKNELYLEKITMGERGVGEDDWEDIGDEAKLRMTFVTNNNDTKPNTSIMKAINKFFEDKSDYKSDDTVEFRSYTLPKQGAVLTTWKKIFTHWWGEVSKVLDINKYEVKITQTQTHTADPGPLSSKQTSIDGTPPLIYENPPRLLTIKKEAEGIYSVVETGAIFFEHNEDIEKIKDIDHIAWDFLKDKLRELDFSKFKEKF